MNLQESIAHLESQGWKVNKVGNSFTLNRVGKGLISDYRNPNPKDHHLFDAKGIIHFANIFSNSSNQRTKMKKNLKEFSNGSERTHLRDIIKSNNIEKLEELSLKNPTKQEDIWSWD